jgi:hypothetical protein
MKKLLFSSFAFLLLPAVAAADFTDIAETDYEAAIIYLSDENLVNGYPDDTYRPSASITRAEFLKILLLAKFSPLQIAECTNPSFTDVEAGSWFYNYICFGKEEEIVKGYANGSFAPNTEISYAEAGKIMVNTLVGQTEEGEGDLWFTPFVSILEQQELVPPTVNAPEHIITRGEMAEMIFRFMTSDQTTQDINERIDEPTEDRSDSEAEDADETTEEEITVEVIDEPTEDTESEQAENPETEDTTENEESTDSTQENENTSTYQSNELGLTFSYPTTISRNLETITTRVFEDDNKITFTEETEEYATDATCKDDDFCTLDEEQQYVHTDGFYVVTRLNSDESFPLAILRKIEDMEKDSDLCRIEEEEFENGWTKATLIVEDPEPFITNEDGTVVDEEGKAITEREQRQIRNDEAIQKCSMYAGGFGNSSFLYNEDQSETFFLYLPSYGTEERYIDYASLQFIDTEGE